MLQVYWKIPKFQLNSEFDPEDNKAVIYGDFEAPNIEYFPYCDYFIMGFNTQDSGQIKIYNG